MSNGTIEAIERNIVEANQRVDMGTALRRLKTNKDFKKVILDGYFKEEAVRLVHLKADANSQSAESQKSILAQIDAIGTLSEYLSDVLALASIAAKSVESSEAELEEMRAEELE